MTYLDSVIVIYLLDGVLPFSTRAAVWLAGFEASGGTLVVSDLVLHECLVKPLRIGDAAAVAMFEGFIRRPDVQIAPLTSGVYRRAAELRAARQLRLADALHLAAAEAAGCTEFLTHDYRLSPLPGLAVTRLP